MKRIGSKLMLLGLVVILFSLCGCREKEVPKGVTIVDDFTIISLFHDNALYQQNSTITFEGIAEKDVIMVVTLFNNKGDIVEQNYVKANEEGKFLITLTTPKGSNRRYKITISDEQEKYQHTIENICFGELFLLMGEDFLTTSMSEPLDASDLVELQKSLYLYDYHQNKWLTDYTNDDLTSFIWNYYNVLMNKYTCPIGFIPLTEDTIRIEEWLSLEDLTDNELVVEYLKENGRYFESPYQNGQMSYLYNKGLKPLSSLTFNTIIWYSGISELKIMNLENAEEFDQHLTMFAKMLHIIFNNLVNNFNFQDFVAIQEPSMEINNVAKMRNIEEKCCNYFSDIVLIPTYDLVDIQEEVLIETPIEDIVKRIYDIVIGQKKISGYANLIQEYLEDGTVNKIIIEFSDTNHIQGTNEYYSLKIYDQKGEEINPIIITKYNQLIIDLSYITSEFSEKEESDVSVLNYYEVSMITYGQEEVMTDVGLINVDKMPIIPFVIRFSGE